jgi:hypothetical protein
LVPKPIRKEAGTVGIPSIRGESGKPTAIKSVNGVFALTLTTFRQLTKAAP